MSDKVPRLPRVAPITGKSDVLPLVTFFRDDSVVVPPLRSIAILAAVREEVIDLLRSKGDAAALPAEERDIVTYTRQLMRTNRVDQAVFDALGSRHGVRWLVELTAVLGYFAMIAGIANAFEVPAPPDGDRLEA